MALEWRRFSAGRLILALFFGYLVCTFRLGGAAPAVDRSEEARQILAEAGVSGGVIVHVGCGDGRLTAALRVNEAVLVHGLDVDPANVAKARDYIQSVGLYGPVSAARFDGRRLPYADNLATLLVAEDLRQVSMEEVMRTLSPGGVTYVKQPAQPGESEPHWRKTVKPWPKDIDEWSHYLHGPDNNAVANDTVVGPPRRLQWIEDPKRDRHHDTIAGFRGVVSSGGRIFSIEDEGPIELPYWPGEWALKARDAFNGKLLWRLPIPEWEPVSRPHRTGPIQQPRRLVGAGDRVFATLGLSAPVSALDAATGRVEKVYEGTERTQEILHQDGILYLVVGDPTFPGGVEYLIDRSKRYGHDLEADPSFIQNPKCSIMAVDSRSGERLWEKSGADTEGYLAMSLGVRGERAVYQNEADVVCLDAATGEALWRAPRGKSTRSTIVIGADAVYSADQKSLVAFDLKGGRERWSTDASVTRPVAGPDVFLIRDALWLNFDGGYNLLTGERQWAVGAPRVDTMSHHRCYRDKATTKYLLIGDNGIEFLPLGTQTDISHNFVRGTCQYGILPCNGLIYGTPNACDCNRSVKLDAYLALAAGADEPDGASGDQPPPAESRIERGPAYGQSAQPEAAATVSRPAPSNEWPTFRHDAGRGGTTPTPVALDAGPRWEAKIGGCLSAPVAAGSRIYVAAVDAHTVYSMDETDGSTVWRYTAGGRVDSPPTIYRGLVLFGSADGWVQCLRASDGELVWRFRAAPEERLIGAWEQLESAWPVPGSVLVVDDTAYVCAGRSTFLDGGIYLYGLDPRTGEKKHEYRFSGPWDDEGRHQIVREENRKDVEGGLPDVLSSDGARLYLRNNAFDLQCRPIQKGIPPHLFATAGLLDDTWSHRTTWIVSEALPYGRTPQWYPFEGKNLYAEGEILVVDGEDLFGLKAYPLGRHSVFNPRDSGYVLFTGAVRPAQPAADATKPQRARKEPQPSSVYEGGWMVYIQTAVKAMVKAGDTLFVAGTPNVYDPQDPSGAIRGRKGGVLAAYSTADGSALVEHKLDAAPVFDGLIASNGKLYLSLKDGRLVCWGS